MGSVAIHGIDICTVGVTDCSTHPPNSYQCIHTEIHTALYVPMDTNGRCKHLFQRNLQLQVLGRRGSTIEFFLTALGYNCSQCPRRIRLITFSNKHLGVGVVAASAHSLFFFPSSSAFDFLTLSIASSLRTIAMAAQPESVRKFDFPSARAPTASLHCQATIEARDRQGEPQMGGRGGTGIKP